MATVSTLLLALVEGKTYLPISGVFGAAAGLSWKLRMSLRAKLWVGRLHGTEQG